MTKKTIIPFFISLLFITIMLFLHSCEEILRGIGTSEGYIEFDISYPKISSENNEFEGLMPSTMVYKFKDEKSSYTFVAGMGVFKATFISDSKKREIVHLIKLLNKKYGLKLNEKDALEMSQDIKNVKLNFTDETKEIAGYNCKKVDVEVLYEGSVEKFSVFYTDEIKVKNPNWSTPFHEIEGVLMEYQFYRFDFLMKFTAKKVVKADVEDSEFEFPNEYQKITIEEMNDLFLTFK
jgi:GLPGLI family protein